MNTIEWKWTEAGADDEGALFELIEAFYMEDQIELRPGPVRTALRALLREPQLGRVFLLKNSSAPGSAPGGYVVVVFWHSLEFGGRVALLDELYLAPAARGRGLAPRTLDMVGDWARREGAVAVRLEVNHHNKRAMEIYLKAGFKDDKRDILTLML
ncbi:GNAT family N-acetyltransferase [Ereboglobus luteus]|uniref:N-acetyltransferase domain-containing protein n=1 Tax=Ereboglobus luteus TaxID=1796921 RepID=A0A2U8E1A2_9BACT|nr:GNAT family N-acetyltransferase [Ereboglobus luteus]AWI08648.1 hypothetical protein CKA38_04705 [Ereboglobus luteus]